MPDCHPSFLFYEDTMQPRTEKCIKKAASGRKEMLPEVFQTGEISRSIVKVKRRETSARAAGWICRGLWRPLAGRNRSGEGATRELFSGFAKDRPCRRSYFARSCFFFAVMPITQAAAARRTADVAAAADDSPVRGEVGSAADGTVVSDEAPAMAWLLNV